MSTAITTETLVKEFVERAIVQATATHPGKSNQAARRLAGIYREIRNLGPASLAMFLHLVTHEDEAVRLWAASYCLEFAPTASESVLEALAMGAPGPIRASASMTLREWRSGRLTFP